MSLLCVERQEIVLKLHRLALNSSPSHHLILSRYQRNGQRAIRDIKAMFGMAPPDPDQDLNLVTRTETLLKPLLGPTAADNALLQEDDDDESRDESMMDDDEEDDDDMGSGDEA
jgi:hypothetical protein